MVGQNISLMILISALQTITWRVQTLLHKIHREKNQSHKQCIRFTMYRSQRSKSKQNLSSKESVYRE